MVEQHGHSSARGGHLRCRARGALAVAVLTLAIARFAPAAGAERTGSPPPGAAPVVAGCAVLPADNVWNVPVDLLPLHPRSRAWIDAMGAESPLIGAAGAGAASSTRPRISWAQVGRPAPLRDVAFESADQSDPGPYPIPESSAVELGPSSGPVHLVLLDSSRCTVYELYGARSEPGGWSASSGAIYDLGSNDLRPVARVPELGPGLPLFPGLLRFDEVDSGEIRHALSFSAPHVGAGFVWPARRALPSSDGLAPPVGQRFRLRGDLDLSAFSERVQVVLKALQRYGMFLVEEGEPWLLSGAQDARWSEDELAELSAVRGRDFVAVDTSLIQIADDSGRVRIQLESQPLVSGSGQPFECVPGEQVACVGGGRFDVRVHWVDGDGTPRSAHSAVTRSDDSSLFWFFEPSNWELMVKVVDGCAVNGHHWVFFAGTTDRGFTLTVADSRTGQGLVYTSPPGQPAAAVTDSDAFATCSR